MHTFWKNFTLDLIIIRCNMTDEFYWRLIILFFMNMSYYDSSHIYDVTAPIYSRESNPNLFCPNFWESISNGTGMHVNSLVDRVCWLHTWQVGWPRQQVSAYKLHPSQCGCNSALDCHISKPKLEHSYSELHHLTWFYKWYCCIVVTQNVNACRDWQYEEYV